MADADRRQRGAYKPSRGVEREQHQHEVAQEDEEQRSRLAPQQRGERLELEVREKHDEGRHESDAPIALGPGDSRGRRHPDGELRRKERGQREQRADAA